MRVLYPRTTEPPGVDRDLAPSFRAPEDLEVWALKVGDDEFALLAWPDPAVGAGCAARLLPLTAAEAEVASLAAQGLSNAAIAQARGSAVRTVANQLAAIFCKLGIGSRLELYAFLTGRRSAGADAEGDARVAGARVKRPAPVTRR